MSNKPGRELSIYRILGFDGRMIIDDLAGELDPRVRMNALVLLAHADAHLRRHPAPAKQPPESDRLRQARRHVRAAARRDTDQSTQSLRAGRAVLA